MNALVAAAPHDVLVRGRGAVGLSLALALARQGLKVAVVGEAAAPRAADVRAYALNAASRGLLRSLKVWDAMPADAACAVQDMRIHGDDPAARPLHFSAWQQQVEALAWIVDAAALDEALAAAARFAPHLSLLEPGQAPEAVPSPLAALTVLAEGKASASRQALGVRFERQPYGHTGLATRLVADRPHQGCARQWFRQPDVLALLPFDRPEAGRSYGLVWSMPEAEARRWTEAPEAEFEQALNEATGGQAGQLKLAGERVGWPLGLAHAEPLCGPGWVLVGDAAHLVHPLAGQGLNLGLGDVIGLTEVIAAREAWRGLGDEKLLRRYARARAWPTFAMAQATDGLWQLFGQEQPLLRAVRNQGLGLVDRLGPLKRWLAGQAIQG